MRGFVRAVATAIALLGRGGKANVLQHRKLVRIPESEAIPRCYVVEIRHPSDLASLVEDFPEIEEPSYIYRQALQGFATCFAEDADESNLLQTLLNDDRVVRIGQDGRLQEEVEQEEIISITMQKQQAAPLHLDRIDGTLDTVYSFVLDAPQVTVYIMDSGIRASHSEFGDRVDKDCFEKIPGTNTSSCLNDAVNDHGTHIAALVGGTMSGVAKRVHLHNVRVRDANDELTWSSVYAGWDYILEHHRTTTNQTQHAIVNLSLSGQANEQADAVAQSAMDQGMTLVVAAGNQHGDACERSPARLADAIAIAATDYLIETIVDDENTNTTLTTFQDIPREMSNKGSCVTIWAPGSDIPSASTEHDNAYAIKSGTSMSSPLVAGALALYHEAGYIGDTAVATLLEHAAWVDALTVDNTTGKFLSLSRLNELALNMSLPVFESDPTSPTKTMNPTPTIAPTVESAATVVGLSIICVVPVSLLAALL